MVLEFYAWQSLYINLLADSIEEQDEPADVQNPAKKSNINSNGAPTKVPISLKALTPLFIFLLTKDLFTKFIKAFVKSTQA